MQIIVDTRQKQGKHDLKHDYMVNADHELVFKKLDVGDYMMDGGVISVDTKQDMLELCNNLFHDFERFRNELMRARNHGIKMFVLIEDDDVESLADVRHWKSEHTKVRGQSLEKRILHMQNRFGAKFLFCKKVEAGQVVVDILNEKRR